VTVRAGWHWRLVRQWHPAYQRNELNQHPRADTTGALTNLGQGYRYDDAGNMLEPYVAADMNR
jgi:hypothetical protein